MRLHGRRAHLQVLLWKAADQPDPPAVDITLFGWDKKMGLKEGEELIMPTQDSSPVAPPALLDVVSCGCKAGLKPCTSAKCSCAAAGLACTSYCSCKGNTHAATYLHNTKNTKRGMKGLEKMMTEQKRIVKMMRLPFVN